MTNELITPSKSLGYTDIYLDFLTDTDPARNFYRAESVAAVADQLDRISFDRDKLVEILIRQNQQYQASPQTSEMIEKLRDPRAVCVFSGQQAGLLGGPMLTLVKAVAVAVCGIVSGICRHTCGVFNISLVFICNFSIAAVTLLWSINFRDLF